MNKSKIRAVAMALLNETLATRKRGVKIGYNQRDWKDKGRQDHGSHACDTTACIGGQAVFLFAPEVWKAYSKYRGDGMSIFNHAKKIFGISVSEANHLFGGDPMQDREPTPRDAALVLFNLAETGKVDWSVAENA